MLTASTVLRDKLEWNTQYFGKEWRRSLKSFANIPLFRLCFYGSAIGPTICRRLAGWRHLCDRIALSGRRPKGKSTHPYTNFSWPRRSTRPCHWSFYRGEKVGRHRLNTDVQLRMHPASLSASYRKRSSGDPVPAPYRLHKSIADCWSDELKPVFPQRFAHGIGFEEKCRNIWFVGISIPFGVVIDKLPQIGRKVNNLSLTQISSGIGDCSFNF